MARATGEPRTNWRNSAAGAPTSSTWRWARGVQETWSNE